MSTTRRCQAKNPATCRVHGSTNRVAVLRNANLAYANLRNSKKELDFANNLEELSEKKQLVHHDQVAYDATLKGLSELGANIYKARQEGFSKELEVKARIKDALEYRKSVLKDDPSWREANSGYESVTATATSKVIVKRGEGKEKTIAELKNIQPGSRVAVKLKNGGFLYDQAGDGLVPEAKRGFLSNLVSKPNFIQDLGGDSSISLRNSGIRVRLNEIEEVSVVSEHNSLPKPPSPSLHQSNTDAESQKVESRWVILGKGYHYNIEGSQSKGLWTGGDIFLDPRQPTGIYQSSTND